MPFFGANYTLRRYGKDKIVNGYPTAGYEDITVFLDVQTMSDNEVVNAGGSRHLEISPFAVQSRRKAFGQISFCMMGGGLNVYLHDLAGTQLFAIGHQPLNWYRPVRIQRKRRGQDEFWRSEATVI